MAKWKQKLRIFYRPRMTKTAKYSCAKCAWHKLSTTHSSPEPPPPVSSGEARRVTATRQSGNLFYSSSPVRAATIFLSRQLSTSHWKTGCQCRGDKWGPHPPHLQEALCSLYAAESLPMNLSLGCYSISGSIYLCSEALKLYSTAEHTPTSI